VFCVQQALDAAQQRAHALASDHANLLADRDRQHTAAQSELDDVHRRHAALEQQLVTTTASLKRLADDHAQCADRDIDLSNERDVALRRLADQAAEHAQVHAELRANIDCERALAADNGELFLSVCVATLTRLVCKRLLQRKRYLMRAHTLPPCRLV
jgi:septal ring factor EnvC (AmiA/AmiB activator)